MHATNEGGCAKPLELVAIAPPPGAERARRQCAPAGKGEKRTRYHLPDRLDSPAPVGYRVRVPLSRADADIALRLLALGPPTAFVATTPPTEQELFEESSLGVLTARQSTNYRGHRQVTLGPDTSAAVAGILRTLDGAERTLDGAAYTHVLLSRPYRTPFTFLLTFIGHGALTSPFTVVRRAWQKKFAHRDDIPSVGYLQQLHIGVLADAVERAAIIASEGKRRANVQMRPFSGQLARANQPRLAALEALCGITAEDRAAGWRIALVAQVGEVDPTEQIAAPHDLWRRLGANLMAFRSERIQPGVNHEEKAPREYQARQTMDVPDELTVQAGRAAYNAFARWTGCDRERAKDLVLLERVDVLTPDGKRRLREVRDELGAVTERIVTGIPTWADLATGKKLSSSAARGKKAFALAGQRVYIGGLSRREVENQGLDWELAVRAFGAAASRSALLAELMGVVDLPADCDLLAGVCLMAGPVNQNDIGKEFYGYRDLLTQAFADRDPTSLLVWTLKAKTVADPIGNEEQLVSRERKGSLVDLRPGPHDVVRLRAADGTLTPMRQRDGRTNAERAYADVANFVTSPDGHEIPGNRGSAWPRAWASARVWPAGGAA
jgi:hypothetical protein